MVCHVMSWFVRCGMVCHEVSGVSWYVRCLRYGMVSHGVSWCVRCVLDGHDVSCVCHVDSGVSWCVMVCKVCHGVSGLSWFVMTNLSSTISLSDHVWICKLILKNCNASRQKLLEHDVAICNKITKSYHQQICQSYFVNII